MYSCTDLAPFKKSFYLFIRIGGRAGGMVRDGAGGGAEGGAYLRVRAAVGDAGYGAGIGVATRAGGVLPVYDHVRVQVVTAILVDGTPMTHVLRRDAAVMVQVTDGRRHKHPRHSLSQCRAIISFTNYYFPIWLFSRICS